MTKDAAKKAKQERIKQQEEALNEEMQEWQKMNLHPAGVQIIGLFLDTQFRTLVELLQETGLVDKEVLDIKYRDKLLETLQAQRELIGSQATKQSILEGIELPPGVIDKVMKDAANS